jgi:hypothetical protein
MQFSLKNAGVMGLGKTFTVYQPIYNRFHRLLAEEMKNSQMQG